MQIYHHWELLPKPSQTIFSYKICILLQLLRLFFNHPLFYYFSLIIQCFPVLKKINKYLQLVFRPPIFLVWQKDFLATTDKKRHVFTFWKISKDFSSLGNVFYPKPASICLVLSPFAIVKLIFNYHILKSFFVFQSGLEYIFLQYFLNLIINNGSS